MSEEHQLRTLQTQVAEEVFRTAGNALAWIGWCGGAFNRELSGQLRTHGIQIAEEAGLLARRVAAREVRAPAALALAIVEECLARLSEPEVGELQPNPRVEALDLE